MKRMLYVFIFLYFIMSIGGCTYIPSTESQADIEKKEIYTVVKGDISRTKNTVLLKTMASWYGEESKNINYKAVKSPWVINYGATPTSKLGSKLNVTVYRRLSSDVKLSLNPYGITLIEETGDFEIEVESSGCKWWVKIGVE